MSGQTLQVIEVFVCLSALTLIEGVPATDYLFYQSSARPTILAMNGYLRLEHCVSMEVLVRMPKGTDIFSPESPRTFVGMHVLIGYTPV